MQLAMPRCFRALLLLCLFATVALAGAPARERRGSISLSSPLDTRDMTFSKRVTANGCANVDVRVRNVLNTGTVLLAENVCICIVGGALTPSSVGVVEGLANVNSGGIIGSLLAILGLDQIRADITARLLSALGAAPPDTCNYPTGAIPACPPGSCNYACPTNQYVCGNQCIANTRSCISNIPGPARKRDLSDSRCPGALSACAIPGARKWSRAYECVDTTSTLDSCGGCAFPLDGEPAGEDCSLLEGADDVKCIAGKCLASTCIRGFQLIGSRCVPKLITQV